ncbi:MAG: hypothetical protein AD742_18500 [Methylibium sp. NZG]|nr:MAG: hypothetical protein AD742_18500 [Methylibium sp. NZG]
MRMRFLKQMAATLALGAIALLGSGCTTAIVLVSLHSKLTEDEPIACRNLNSVERALLARCAPFQAGSLVTKDVHASGFNVCPLTLAARDPRFWPVLPELLAKGAQPERCEQAPLRALAQADACPPFERASATELAALRWLARADARAVQHDVVRVLSCPSARATGLATVLDEWRADGWLSVGQVSFSPLGALHPGHLGSPLARALEQQGHTARAALIAYDGRLPGGFDAALRSADLAALDWWLQRAPELVNRVPPNFSGQTAWVPLAKALAPAYTGNAAQQRRVVEHLMARGADPWLRLPHEPQRTVVSLAREMNSPMLPLLDRPLERALHRLPDRPLDPPRTPPTGSKALAQASLPPAGR